MDQFRIDYTITRRRNGEDDFTEIGFGSGSGGTVDAALYHAQSDVQNRLWETAEGMPEPAEV